jgi:hypothetical protein
MVANVTQGWRRILPSAAECFLDSYKHILMCIYIWIQYWFINDQTQWEVTYREVRYRLWSAIVPYVTLEPCPVQSLYLYNEVTCRQGLYIDILYSVPLKWEDHVRLSAILYIWSNTSYGVWYIYYLVSISYFYMMESI